MKPESDRRNSGAFVVFDKFQVRNRNAAGALPEV
jgi:hypothetical protein